MYPLPATSMELTPSTGPRPAISFVAIALGACFNCRASWKATGMAKSPKEDCFGCSNITGTSAPYCSRTCAVMRAAMDCSSLLNTNSSIRRYALSYGTPDIQDEEASGVHQHHGRGGGGTQEE